MVVIVLYPGQYAIQENAIRTPGYHVRFLLISLCLAAMLRSEALLQAVSLSVLTGREVSRRPPLAVVSSLPRRNQPIIFLGRKYDNSGPFCEIFHKTLGANAGYRRTKHQSG